MQSLLRIGLVGLVLMSVACAQAADKELKTQKDKASYIIGADTGAKLGQIKEFIDLDQVIAGLKDAWNGEKIRIEAEEAQKVMAQFQQDITAKQQAEHKAIADKNAKEGKEFLDANAKKEGVKTLPDGLQYKVLVSGKGESPKATDTVVTHYSGSLISGKVFDSSYKRGQPATFPVNGVIKGWTEALQKMKVGDKWQLFIPPELAYGESGRPPTIPANSVLIFELELLEVKKP